MNRDGCVMGGRLRRFAKGGGFLVYAALHTAPGCESPHVIGLALRDRFTLPLLRNVSRERYDARRQ
jgi:hypothetical protein